MPRTPASKPGEPAKRAKSAAVPAAAVPQDAIADGVVEDATFEDAAAENAAAETAAVENAAPEPTIVYVPAPSYLDRVRLNRMGPLAAALVIGGLVGLVLSMLVPSPANVWALMLLGTLVAAAVGFGVRYLSYSGSWRAQVPAFLGTVLGAHLMAVTGTINGFGFDNLPKMLNFSGPGFDDALLGALATPAVSTGTILAGLIAAIIVGWGPRDEV